MPHVAGIMYQSVPLRKLSNSLVEEEYVDIETEQSKARKMPIVT